MQDTNLSQINILIVDDNPANVVALEALLKSPEFHLVSTTSPKEAFKLCDQMPFALALIDVQMPILNGFELAQMIRAKNKQIKIPVIFLTAGQPTDQLVTEGYELGAVDFIFKPLNPVALKSKVSFFVELFKKEYYQERVRDLEERESEFKLLANSMPQLAWMANADGFIYWYNQRWYDYTGTTEEDMKGWGWQSVHHPDHLPRVLEEWTSAISKGSPIEFQFPLKGADGKFRWFLTIVRPMFNSKGEVYKWFGTNTDIDESRNAKVSFEKNVDQSPAILWITEKDGSCTYLSKQWYELTGQTEETGLGFGWLGATHPDDKEKAGALFIHANELKIPFYAEYRLRKKDGNYIWAIDAANPRFDSKGNYLGMAGTVLDINDKKMAEEEILKSQEQLKAIIHNMGEGLVISDGDGNMIIWNPAALQLHGFKSQDEILQKLKEYPSLFKLYSINGDILGLNDWPLSRVLRGETLTETEVIVERTDIRSRFFASYSGTPVKDSDGKITMALLTMRDVSDRIQDEKNLKQAIKVRDEFLSIASHELNTPLTSLKLQLQMFDRRLQNNQEIDIDILKKISSISNKQIERTVRLIEDMLDVSRISTGTFKLNVEPCDLNELMTNVMIPFEDVFKVKGITLKLEMKDKINIDCDCFRLEQVISNLITNAMKYGDSKPVMVSLYKKDNSAVICVKDNGIGIAQEHLDTIFSRFERVSTSSNIGGLGLGLYISKQIINKHNGKIEVESEPDKGSTFRIVLPLRQS